MVLVSGDDVRCETTQKVAKTCQLLADMLEEEDSEEVVEVPLPEVLGSILKKVVEFCAHHVDDPLPPIPKPVPSSDMTEAVPAWDAKFIDEDKATVFNLILAANYLDNPPLLNLACAKIASLAVGKPIKEIRKIFGIQTDLTKEEMEMLEREKAFED